MQKMILAAIALSIIIGCNNSVKNQASPPTGTDRTIRAQQTVPDKPKITNPGEVAGRLERIAASTPGVRGANCVIVGNTAVVGIDVDAKMERSRVGTLKYSVAEALRKDPYGKYAIVTADMDLAQRLREIRTDINRGRPIAGFAEEMADIIGRIIPQLPKDVVPRGEHPATETNPKLKGKSL